MLIPLTSLVKFTLILYQRTFVFFIEFIQFLQLHVEITKCFEIALQDSSIKMVIQTFLKKCLNCQIIAQNLIFSLSNENIDYKTILPVQQDS